MWVLILLVYAGPMAHGNDVALTSVEGFSSPQLCEVAGQKATSKLSPGTKSAEYVCVQNQVPIQPLYR